MCNVPTLHLVVRTDWVVKYSIWGWDMRPLDYEEQVKWHCPRVFCLLLSSFLSCAHLGKPMQVNIAVFPSGIPEGCLSTWTKGGNTVMEYILHFEKVICGVETKF